MDHVNCKVMCEFSTAEKLIKNFENVKEAKKSIRRNATRGTKQFDKMALVYSSKFTSSLNSHCPISKIPGPFNSAHRALQVEACASKILKKGRTLKFHVLARNLSVVI